MARLFGDHGEDEEPQFSVIEQAAAAVAAVVVPTAVVTGFVGIRGAAFGSSGMAVSSA
jgi:hypothetical protein